MPEIARFFGIIIRMYSEPGMPHHQPHFHAYYQNNANEWKGKGRKKMSHSVYRVVEFQIVRPYTLWVKFDDGEEREIDFQPVLAGQVYGALHDEKLFNQVEIDPEVHTLVWPNGADFDTETLHDWPKYVDEMKRMARQ